MRADTVSKLVMPNVDELARKHFMRMMKRSIFVLVLLLTLVVLINEKHRLVLMFDHPIEKVSVSGALTYQDSDALKEHVGHFVGQGFLSADLERVKQHVESLPWVYQATVSRVWPGEIKATIEEQIAVGYWNSVGLINGEGALFLPDVIPQDLVLPRLQYEHISNDAERLEMYQLFNYIQQELSVFSLQVLSLTQEARGTWELTLSNGIDVVLGHINQQDDSKIALDDKLERVGKLLNGKNDISPDKINRLDTRYPNGIAVQWNDSDFNK